MVAECVVDALNIVHRSLRPSGVILDIRPEPQASQVEVRVYQRTEIVGHLDESALIGNIHDLETAMTAAIETGLFHEARSSSFDFLYYCNGVDEFTTHVEEYWRTPELDPILLSRARRLLKDREGKIVIREPIKATRLWRGEPA